VETVAEVENAYFGSFAHLLQFEIIRDNIQLPINTVRGKITKCTWENTVCGGNVEIIAVSEI
jgi:hypothetical protein